MITIAKQTTSASLVARYKRIIILFSILAPTFIVASLLASVAVETPKHGGKTDPNFQYGKTSAVVSLVVLGRNSMLLINLID